ncbi:MAG: hypothetical protein ACM3ML_04000 [Micromonosporaceae bacterium]
MIVADFLSTAVTACPEYRLIIVVQGAKVQTASVKPRAAFSAASAILQAVAHSPSA